MCPWWKPKDNETLLREYHKRGVYLHKRHRELLRIFAEGLLRHSNSCVDFSVEVSNALEPAISPAPLRSPLISLRRSLTLRAMGPKPFSVEDGCTTIHSRLPLSVIGTTAMITRQMCCRLGTIHLRVMISPPTRTMLLVTTR